MKILRATVLVGFGADQVMLEMDLPNPIWPYEGHLSLDFKAAKGIGANYVRDHFDIIPDITNRDEYE